MKSKNQPVILYKSSDQGMFQRGDQATNKGIRLSEANGYKAYCYIIKQSRTFMSAIKHL